MADYIDILHLVLENHKMTNVSYSNVLQHCTRVIPHEIFRQYILLPAVVFTMIMVMSNRVTGQRFNILYSRPGYVFPLDIFKRSHRFFLAAAYGTLAHLCTGIIVESKYAFSYHGPRYLRGLITLVSMLVYGLGYLPLILGISLESPIGYLAAIPFSWIFTAEFFTSSLCRQKNTISDIVLFLSVLPEIVCFLFLSIGLPIQLGLCIYKQSKCRFTMFPDFQSSDDCYESIKNSYQGKYVINILKRPRKSASTSEPLRRYVTERLKHILGHVFYEKSNTFRISSRMVSINVVGFIVIYRIAFFLVTNVYSVLKFCEDVIISHFLRIGIDPQPDDNDSIVKYRACLFSSYKFLVTFKECFLVSMILCLVLNLLFLQRNFITYRNNLLSLYKGRSPILITTREETTNPRLMVGSMRYAGYQVGHIGGGFTIQCIMVILNCLAVAWLVIVWDYCKEFILDQLLDITIMLTTGLAICCVQYLLSKFLFLQEKGNILGIKNRRLFFITSYFLFFYIIFIGVFHSILRILSSVILGTFFLPRLDYSVLPRKFQIIDLGFSAYCGFLHLENVQTNPIAMIFISILQAESQQSRKAIFVFNHDTLGKQTELVPNHVTQASKQKIRGRARWLWSLAFTLVNNPNLVSHRMLKLPSVKSN